MKKYENTTGLILAGGRAQRMNGEDKGLVQLNGHDMIEYVLASLAPQVGQLIINANRNLEAYEQLGCSVVSDELSDFQGPLAGFISGMQFSHSQYIVTAPCDGPFLCNDYVARLHQHLAHSQSKICVAHDGNRLQPVYALIDTSLIDSLRAFLLAGDRKIDLWYQQEHYCTADFSDTTEIFTNINTPEELALASTTIQPPNYD